MCFFTEQEGGICLLSYFELEFILCLYLCYLLYVFVSFDELCLCYFIMLYLWFLLHWLAIIYSFSYLLHIYTESGWLVFLTMFVCFICLYLCLMCFLFVLVSTFLPVCVCSGVLCGPCGPSMWLGVQQESQSREQQHRGADGVLSPELVSIVLCNWIWSGRRDGCQWEPAIIRCEWDVWCQGWTHTHI